MNMGCRPSGFQPGKCGPLFIWEWSLLVVDFVTAQARSLGMEDLSAKLEKLLIEAEDCDLIGRLATDLNKRELFKKMAIDLHILANDIQAAIAARAP